MTSPTGETIGLKAILIALAAFGFLGLLCVFAYFTDTFAETKRVTTSIDTALVMVHVVAVLAVACRLKK